MIDCIYVIALEETLSTKRQELIDRVGELNLKSEQLILFKAVNGFTPQVDFKWEKFAWKIKDSDNGWWNRDLKAGEVGCALSHLCVWKHAATQKYKKILILEEDFKPVDVLSLTLLEELDQLDWHLCYAGRNKVKPDIKSATANIAVPDYTYCTHAYLLSQAGVENLISHRFENKIMPVDEFLSATFCNHPREDLNFIWKDLKTFAFKKDYVVQSNPSGISTTENLEKAVAPPSAIKASSNWDEWTQKYINPAMINKDFDLLVDEPVADVAHFPIFTKKFCEDLIDEAEKCGKWTDGRHDHYPTHDMLLSTFNFDNIYKRALMEYVFPLAMHYYKLEGKRWLELNSENFIIKYSMDKQGFLSLHHDQSVLSSVLTLNEDFEGGGTFFYRQQKTIVGKTGEMSLHPGMVSHRHGARPITSGVRYVLVSFLSLP